MKTKTVLVQGHHVEMISLDGGDTWRLSIHVEDEQRRVAKVDQAMRCLVAGEKMQEHFKSRHRDESAVMEGVLTIAEHGQRNTCQPTSHRADLGPKLEVIPVEQFRLTHKRFQTCICCQHRGATLQKGRCLACRENCSQMPKGRCRYVVG